jgi:dipeptidyl aminopeptidase/acylaminoacyl peptidase
MKKVLSARSAIFACAVLITAATAYAAGRPITVNDLLSLPRISEPRLSPDGTRVVYTVAVPDLNTNRTARDAWMATLATGDTRALTTGGHEGAARWSPDGKSIDFISTRSGGMQLYLMNADDSGSAKPISSISSDVDGIVWAPNGHSIAFTANVFPVLINRRGSTGFGQKFTDEIISDWGGKAFADVMNGLESVLARYSFADRQRIAAAGGSCGGYLVDWLASQSNGRLGAIISQAGVYDLTSIYGATEELWFPEHDFGGTPWTNPSAYQKWSPSSYARTSESSRRRRW